QDADPRLAGAVGGGGVQQVDTEIPGLGQEIAGLPVVGDGEARRVLDPLVAAELDGAAAEHADRRAGLADGAARPWHRGLQRRGPGGWRRWPGAPGVVRARLAPRGRGRAPPGSSPPGGRGWEPG